MARHISPIIVLLVIVALSERLGHMPRSIGPVIVLPLATKLLERQGYIPAKGVPEISLSATTTLSEKGINTPKPAVICRSFTVQLFAPSATTTPAAQG